jgi:hypothetical protein
MGSTDRRIAPQKKHLIRVPTTSDRFKPQGRNDGVGAVEESAQHYKVTGQKQTPGSDRRKFAETSVLTARPGK